MPEQRTSPDIVLDDLVAEHGELDDLVAHIGEQMWDVPTPAAGWSVRDQVSHLAFFDDAANLALSDPQRFSAMARSALEQDGDPMEEHLRRGRELKPSQLLDWWRTSRAVMVGSARSTPPHTRVPWFGPDMALTSFLSARLMETWAHGQDVADALGVRREPSDRLRHVAHLGVRARPFSYIVRGLDVPTSSVTVELDAPSGEKWVWEGGPSDASNSKVSGSALDFCLVVTQRRNVDDTGLEAVGSEAREWLEIAQAFAGPPGAGRAPGQFSV